MNFQPLIKTNPTEIVCGICGEAHKYSECSVVQIGKHIPDNVIPSKARLTLPEGVCIETMADGSYSVVSNTCIEKGTQFGPLEAQRLLTLNPSIIFPLKLFNSDVEDLSEYYLDTCDESSCNWMIFVAPAQTIEEQNLICFQEKSKIYYVAIKDIQAGSFLKVWYAPYYATKMKKNVLTSQNPPEPYDNNVVQVVDINELMKKQQNIMERENWICKFCGKIENEVSLFATHMSEHYSTRITKKYCDVCKQSFSNQRNLRRHIKSIHNKESKKYKMKEAPPEKAKNKDILVGGPLLNDLLTDSLDNTNLVMPNLELNQFGIALTNSLENQNMLLESDTLSLNVDNLLTENVKGLFNFEIDEAQEQHVCDVCLKVFSKLSYLIQHLKKHTGKFTCRYCLKIFCRSENLNAHKCNLERTPKFTCSLCQRSFMLRKYLVRHMNAIHDKKYSCENCHRQYHSHKEYKEHNCSAVPDQQKATFTCHTCNKTFFREVYLKKHLRTHLRRERKVLLPKQLICEVCAQRFSTRKGLKLHNKSHLERNLTCKMCSKKFYRQDVLDIHMATHEEAKITCPVCNVKLKSKQILTVHMHQHTGVKSHQCDMCSQAFYQRSALVSHYSKVHLNMCRLCKKGFETKELLEKHKTEHSMKEYFQCPICNKNIKLRSSLRRHLKQFHPDQDSNNIMSAITPKEVIFKKNTEKANMENLFNDDLLYITEKASNTVVSSDQNCNKSDIPASVNLDNVVPENDNDSFENIVNNFESMINSYGSNDATDLLPTSYDSIGESSSNQERILDFTDLEIDLDSNFGLQQNLNINNQEVCLSMPDLMDTDQEIMLGENAYMLDDGTIVEPKEQGNVFVYVLDK